MAATCFSVSSTLASAGLGLQTASLASLRPDSSKVSMVPQMRQSSSRRTVAVARASSESNFGRTLVAAAAAAALVFGGIQEATIAATGPGGDAAGQTARKADELLKAADDLTTNESPPRFGPGRVDGDETAKLAQDAGNGAEAVKEGASGAAQGLISKIFGDNK
eukprot:jgi/Mesen1/6208/ME000320S05404